MTPRREARARDANGEPGDEHVTEHARRRWLGGEAGADALLASVVLVLAVLAFLVR